MLEEVKAGRLAGIYCVNWKRPAQRARKFGKSWWTVIPQGEDAILMLDSADPLNGQPLIAFRRELSPKCGELKFAPEFAGFRETVQFFGASVPKIAALYAVFQLQHDLQVMAAQTQITTGSDLLAKATQQWDQEKLPRGSQPKIQELFDLKQAPRVELSRDLEELLCCTFHLSCNRTASLLIHKVGFPYLASVLRQSGLFHKTRGGLWLKDSYGKVKDCPQNCSEGRAECNAVFASQDRLTSTPVNLIGQKRFSPQNVTALSAATYFTLLAQERLVSPEASRRIKQELSRACTFFAASDDKCNPKVFKNESIPLTQREIAVKCGFNPPPRQTKQPRKTQQVTHDCILVERPIGTKQLRYVVVLLTENARVHGAPLIGQHAHCFFRNQFLVDVDKIIQDRNS